MNEDLQHWLNLVNATKHRLHKLEEQKARLGYATPPHVETEIAQAYSDLEVYAARLAEGPPPSQKAQDQVEGDANLLVLTYRVKQIDEKFTAALKSVIEMVNHIGDVSETYRNAEREIRIERQQEHDERMTKMEKQAYIVSGHVERLTDRLDWVVWRVVLIVGAMSIAVILAVWWLK